MTDAERDAILSICLLAAFADGISDERERAEIERIAGSLPAAKGADASALLGDVYAGRRTVESAAAELSSPEQRKLAQELAVGVCNADGMASPAEKEFLERLRRALGLEAASAEAFAERASAIATAPLSPSATAAAPDQAALDQAILDASILNGALELLPESLATLAIIPLQMRLVYRVGKAYGYELDEGHVKDFLATAGVGLASQYVEQVGRKLVGGLLGALAGRMLGGLGRQAVSSATAFASTYALGHVAKRYYAGGRQLSADALRAALQDMVGQAQQLRERYGGEIERRAKGLDVAQIVRSVRGS
jgi:uncharacterized protein (DUF697 family)/tellurite resistance protein